MTEFKTEIRVTLSTPIRYSTKGEFKETEILVLKAPTNRVLSQVSFLQQGFMRVIRAEEEKIPSSQIEEIKAENNSSGGDELNGKQMMLAIKASEFVDFQEYANVFRDMLTHNLAFLDGEEKLTKPVLDEIYTHDMDKIMEAYFENFIIASLINS